MLRYLGGLFFGFWCFSGISKGVRVFHHDLLVWYVLGYPLCYAPWSLPSEVNRVGTSRPGWFWIFSCGSEESTSCFIVIYLYLTFSKKSEFRSCSCVCMFENYSVYWRLTSAATKRRGTEDKSHEGGESGVWWPRQPFWCAEIVFPSFFSFQDQAVDAAFACCMYTPRMTCMGMRWALGSSAHCSSYRWRKAGITRVVSPFCQNTGELFGGIFVV